MDSSVVSEDQMNEIKTKMHFTGKVVKVGLAGAVLDLGISLPAVIHVSQVVPPTEEPIKRLSDVLQPGQEVEVWVKKVKDGRVETTMFKPLDLEWRDLKKDMVVKGKVVRLEKFGAFVEIGAERPGLVHISEMAHGYVRTPADVVKEGDEIEAMVLDVNRKKKQIKLSMKALQPEPVKEEPASRPVMEPFQPREKAAKKPRKQSPRRKGGESFDDVELLANLGEPAETEAEPTAMEIAIREAMEKAKVKKQDKSKKKGVSQEQEDLLSRTLESKQTNA